MAQSSSTPFVVDVSTRTWARDKHNYNLFDFEASRVTAQNFTIKDSVTCVRTENDVDMVPFDATQDSTTREAEKLIQLEFRHGSCCINRPESQNCWLLIRDSEERRTAGHTLAEHDVIKFGRSQFKVRQLSVKPNVFSKCFALGDRHNSICKVDPSAFEELADEQCRICLCAGSCMEDPLLAPCQCKGSIGLVHFGCLRHWVRDRLGLSNGDAAFVIGGNPNKLACELCKTPYKTTIQLADKLMPLVEIDSPFIVLESCSDDRQYVLPIVPGKVLTIGRDKECTLAIRDQSMSRVHASIELVDGRFVVRDRGSRFGTFIKIWRELLLDVGHQSSVQVGRTLCQLSLKRSISPSPEPLPQIASADTKLSCDSTHSISTSILGSTRCSS